MKTKRAAFLSTVGAAGAVGLVRYPAGAAEFNFKLALVVPPAYPHAARSIEAAEKTLKDTGGRLDIKAFPNSQLGGDTEVLSQVRLGAVEMFLVANAYLSNTVPVAAIPVLPFVVASRKAGETLSAGDFGKYMRAAIARAGMYALPGPWEAGFRQIENAVRPINTPADMRGLKIGISGSAGDVALYKVLGATPVQSATADLYTSLQTHLIDGTQFPLNGIEQFKFYEVAKYVTYTNHTWLDNTMVANGDAWNKMPRNIRDIAERNFEAARNLSNEDVTKVDAAAADRLTGHGMVFNNPDLPAFRRVVREGGLYAQWKSLYGNEAWSLLEKAVGPLA